jgi:hypothetical protein
MPLEDDGLSTGLLFFGGVAGFGGGSAEADRFASSSVSAGVETGCVGARLAIGFLPPHPPATLKSKIAPK